MAKYTDQKCRLCRREGEKLFLKGKRCLTPKCPIDKRGPVAPGMIGKRRKRTLSEYGIQLREKQKTKRLYGVLEHQFQRYFKEAKKVSGSTGEALLQKLERRLDNVVYRLGLTGSRVEARQLVSHGHVLINGRKINIPSYEVKPGDTVSLSTRGLEIPYVKETFLQKSAIIVPQWLNRKGPVGKIERLPKREEIDSNINEQLVIEYYSR